MNIHKSKKYSKIKELKVYALGIFEELEGFCNIMNKEETELRQELLAQNQSFCDIVNKEGHHVCCIVSMTSEDSKDEIIEKKITNECVIWDEDGFPDIYVKHKLIGLNAIRKGIKMLQKDKHNKFNYELSLEKVSFFTKRRATGKDDESPDIWLPSDKKKLKITRGLFNKKMLAIKRNTKDKIYLILIVIGVLAMIMLVLNKVK